MIIALTGHRPEFFPKENQESWIQKIKENLTYNFNNILEKEDCLVLSGMCYGWDIIGAEVALEYNIEVIGCIPFKGFGKNFPDSWKNRMKDVQEQCKIVHYVQEDYTKDCFFNRDRYMVDRADIIFSLLHPEAQKGGTFYTVKYAKSKNLPILNFWEDEKTS
jgi:uncharacterized phage-like protein YoqJ